MMWKNVNKNKTAKYDFRYTFYIATCIITLTNPQQVRSQIVPDNTLPNNTITLPNGNIVEINGGTSNGNNLFHSFEQFSIPADTTAIFNNATTVENIFSRVTGGDISNIEGLIKANGTANLFLLNPAGIIFGENASINIGGSLFVSTADSFNFSDGSQFSAVNPEAPPLLTVNVPIGLQYGTNPGKIEVKGNGHNVFSDPETSITNRDNRPVGVAVASGKTLALLGGEIELEGGNVTAQSGNIEVWAVADNSQLLIVSNNDTFTIEPSDVTTYTDIALARTASIDVSGDKAGSVRLQGRNIILTDGSILLSETLGDEAGGLLQVNASELIRVDGTTPSFDFPTGILTEIAPGATGRGSNILINSQDLVVSGGGFISSGTAGTGNSGSITVNATSSVDLVGGLLLGDTFIAPSGIFSQAINSDTANSGDININTGKLLVREGANISTLTFFGGNSGSITVNAEEVTIEGTAVDLVPSGFYTVALQGTGQAGAIDIKTGKLAVLDGAQIDSGTFDRGNAGKIAIEAGEVIVRGANSDKSSLSTISTQVQRNEATGNGANIKVDTDILKVNDGGQISTITFGVGNAGDLIVNAEEVELKRATSDSRGGLFASAFQGTGNGGNIDLTTDRLKIEDGASISASNFQNNNLIPPGEGAAGNLNIKADSINLREGIITAEANSGSKGNISIVSDRIVLQDNSLLTTNARGEATGGNITIETDTLTALNNSDITANAVDNFAGRINITATGIFGTEFRQQQTPQSEITASSDLGAEFSGVVQLNTPDVDPASSLNQLPANVIDRTSVVTTKCPASQLGNTFVIVGQGGLPDNPGNSLRGTSVWHDLRAIAQSETNFDLALPKLHLRNPKPIIEAKGWQVSERGQIILTADATEVVPPEPIIPYLQCQEQ